MQLSRILVFCTALAVTACATPQVNNQGKQLPELASAPICQNDLAKISTEHETARVNACKVKSATSFELTILPENTPINNSAWYGFRVDPRESGTLRVTLKYEDGKHRYHPKTSFDGKVWNWHPESHITKEDGDIYEIDMRFDMDERPFFVSAQEILTNKAHDRWSEGIAQRSDTTLSTIGYSKDGYPISMLDIATEKTKKKPYVMWVGRQHPPEVTGALALIPYTEAVLADTKLAKSFRDKFNILIVPNMNPDGVTAGNWRHNKNGVDLNRDWGPFAQPETQAVKSALGRFERGEDQIVFFLDFHSTWRNLLYTQADEEGATPPMFTRDWVKAVDARLDDDVYEFTREARHNSGRPISKNYMFDTYGITAITYEVGDATDRKAIDLSARVFSEEMMRLLLKHEGGS